MCYFCVYICYIGCWWLSQLHVAILVIDDCHSYMLLYWLLMVVILVINNDSHHSQCVLFCFRTFFSRKAALEREYAQVSHYFFVVWWLSVIWVSFILQVSFRCFWVVVWVSFKCSELLKCHLGILCYLYVIMSYIFWVLFWCCLKVH